jgi:Fe-S oxidoreductase
MCKPAGEVANVTMMECHTTRARAMMLWRALNREAEFTPREAELIYQSTLDSISQAWCVNHYPVSGYMAAARVKIFAGGGAPAAVQKTLQRSGMNHTGPHLRETDPPHEMEHLQEVDPPHTMDPPNEMDNSRKMDNPRNMDHLSEAGEKVLFLACEAAETGIEGSADPALMVLQKAGISARPFFIQSGVLAYSLGALEQAAGEAKQLFDLIEKTGAKTVLVDGPMTFFAFKLLYPMLGLSLPENLSLRTLTEEIGAAVEDKRLEGLREKGERIFFHDSRCAAMLGDEMALDQAILPDFFGPESVLGIGEIYELPRRLLDAMGMKRVFTTWSRSLAKSCGADDGLWLTYPEIAEKLALKRLEEAGELGAGVIVTDSLLCSHQLKSVRRSGDVEVKWFPELFQ